MNRPRKYWFAAWLLAVCLGGAAQAADPMLFAYFKDPADMGVFFALSDDGYHWDTLNDGKPWIGIQHQGSLIRDPFITRGPDHEFHLVWTWGWRGQSIGYAHSADLVHWSGQSEIPLMASVRGTKNTWAPEIYWDEGKRGWLIVFSSTIEGGQEGNRIYSAFTPDFKTISRPGIFFDPGYNVIDATILRARGRYYLIFKDERADPLHKELKIADGPSLNGPWSNISDAFTGPWSEGPSAIQVGGKYIVYYDHYRDPKRYEAVSSPDLKHWTPITDKLQFPPGSKHGSFLKITAEEKRRLRTAVAPSR